MKTSVQNISDTKVKITVTLDVEELAIASKTATARLAGDIKAPGFRKGKTPIEVATKYIDPNKLQQQIVDDAINKGVAGAFIDNNIQALERPEVHLTKYVPDEVLEFTAEAEVLPQVKLGDYKKLKATKEKVSVSDAEVMEIVTRIQHGLAERKEVKRAARTGDETVIDFVGKKDGVAFNGGTGNDYTLTLGSNQFIPGFEEGVVGHKAGDTFDLNLTFPDEYHVADLKGAKVVFTVTLKAVKEMILPELDDKFAAKAGPFKTYADLKADINRELTNQKEREADDKLKDDLVQQLVKLSKVPVPAVLVEDQSKSIEQDFTRNLAYQGMTLDQYIESKGYKSHDEWFEKEVKEIAEKRVKAGLVLAELSKAEKVEASTAELDSHVELYKKQYANNPEALKQFELPEVRRDIASRLLTEKTVERLVQLNSK